MEIHTHIPKVGKTAMHWILEGVLIVVSVLLGFAVAQYRESRDNQELAAHALISLRAEMEHNLSVLEPQIAIHEHWASALEHPGAKRDSWKTGRDAFVGTWPGFDPANPKPWFATLRRAAWETAVSTGALRLIDYDTGASLSEIYQYQEDLRAVIGRLPLTTTPFFDPASRDAVTYQLAFGLEAMYLQEQQLVDLYKKELPVLRAASRDR